MKLLHVVDLECEQRSYYLDFSWFSLNYRVGQKVTNFRIFSDPARKLSALTPERGRILCNSEKKLVKHRCSVVALHAC